MPPGEARQVSKHDPGYDRGHHEQPVTTGEWDKGSRRARGAGGAGPGLDEGVGCRFTRNANFIGLSVTVMSPNAMAVPQRYGRWLKARLVAPA